VKITTIEVPYESNFQKRGVSIGIDDVIVCHFTVPPTAQENFKTGSIAAAPQMGAGAYLEGVLSSTAADFDVATSYRSGSSLGQTPTIKWVVGEKKDFCYTAERGDDLYFNIRLSNPAPTQQPSETLIEFHAPAPKG